MKLKRIAGALMVLAPFGLLVMLNPSKAIPAILGAVLLTSWLVAAIHLILE